MSHIPFGYKIVSGKAVTDEINAATVKKIYDNYLSGMSLTDAAKNAGITIYHCSVKKMMLNPIYLGDSFYPQLIDEHTFQKAKEELNKRAKKLGRTNRASKVLPEMTIPINFHMNPPTQKYTDPFMQAEYLYTLIESEMT